MKIPTRPRQRGLRFNITPLIDIIFLLIIFFLAASHLVRSESLEPVDLPKATQSAEDEERVPRRLVVTVTVDRKLHVAGRVVEIGQVEQMILAGRDKHNLNNFEVRIRCDKNVEYRYIEPVMLACAQTRVARIGLAV